MDLINISYCFDYRMWRIAAVSIYSLFKNSRLHYRFNILVDDTISTEVIDYFNVYIKRLDSKSEIYIKESNIKHLLSNETSIYYARLQLTEKFDIDKTIYIDSDTIILTNLKKLYYHNINDKYLAAFINTSYDITTFQSGFMLMNLKKIRDDKLYDQFIKYMNLPPLKQRDQDILNIECGDNSEIFEFLNELDFNQYLVHYYYDLKPWNVQDNDTRNNYNIWWKYCKQTPLYRFFDKHRDKDINCLFNDQTLDKDL
jgi:lipopolysaccharide biosynthesis glycosyltransferase